MLSSYDRDVGIRSFPGWLLSPDGFFPGKTFPGKSFPGWSFSRIGCFPERRFPDGDFPGKTFPGWSFSRMRRFPERLREMTLQSYRTTILRIFKWIYILQSIRPTIRPTNHLVPGKYWASWYAVLPGSISSDIK